MGDEVPDGWLIRHGTFVSFLHYCANTPQVRAQLDLLDSLGIHRLYASIGSSMGGMQSLALAYLEPERVGRVASISATGRSGLNGVGMRFAQRSGELWGF